MAETPSPASPAGPFRVCGSCGKEWVCWRDFVLDPEVHLLGLQLVPNVQDGNLLVFDHSCGTSVSFFAKRLRALVPGAKKDPGRAVTVDDEECAVVCGSLGELAVCQRPCARARDRGLIQAIMALRRGSTRGGGG